jgi:hypothetical protein
MNKRGFTAVAHRPEEVGSQIYRDLQQFYRRLEILDRE